MKDLGRRVFLKLVGTGALVVSCTSSDADEADADTFEYIVVGSGAGGGPLASNLARAGHRVLLLEAGEDRGAELDYQVPAFHPMATEDPSMRWDFFVEHYSDPARQERDAKATPKGIYYPRAAAVGGCTTHNAMITVYPHASDWDFIAELTGDPSWRSDAMRRYFEILEDCSYLPKGGEAKGHGFSGWLGTSTVDLSIAAGDAAVLALVQAAAVESAKSSGLAVPQDLGEVYPLLLRDLNADSPERDRTEGIFTVPMATRAGKRNGPRELILDTIAHGHPLVLRTGALVSRVIFEEARDDAGKLRAVGIEYLEGAHLYRADPNAAAAGAGVLRRVRATREVILSAGAFNTPQLLKLSGIGPREELAALGIEVLVDLPGVGRNLQDRYEVGVVSRVDQDFAVLSGCTWGADVGGQPDPCLADWKSGGDGVYASNGGVVAVVKRSSEDQPDPDLFLLGIAGDFEGYAPGYSKAIVADKRHFTWAVLKAHTGNTAGSVTLRSADPRDMPDIRFHFFDEGTSDQGRDVKDLGAVVAGVELARKISATAAALLAPAAVDEVYPGSAVQTPADIETFVKDQAWGHHASCTCKIGRDDDPLAVLDSAFRVRGTRGLRVVDASVFPRIPGFYIVTSIYMVSEKATDVLLAELGDSRG